MNIVISQAPLTALLACSLFQQETTTRAQILGIVARARFFLGNAVSFRVHCRFCENLFETNGKGKCQEHIVDDLTRPGPRPGELPNNLY